ncbi:MAG TPA: uroporphyrinogen decarboxylase family protein [Chloroflexota bacterium]
MDIKERLLTTLAWGEPDRVPVTVYDWILPRGMAERLVREAGVGLVMRPAAHRVEHRQVRFSSVEYWEGGRRLIRKTVHTPVGEAWQTLDPEAAYDSTWILEHFIKGPDDYRVMEFMVRDAVYHDNYEKIREYQRRIGGDGLVYVRVAKAPIQEMLYQMLGMEQFAEDYKFRRDLFDSLHNAMSQRYMELYEMAAASPAEVILLSDNITSDVVGRQRFREYLLPEYRRLKECLAGTGKLLAVHMDGRLESLIEEVAQAPLDIIEAITPPPMGDVSIKEARLRWPGKALWLNFTSSFHIEPPAVIEAHTRQLLEEAGSKKGFAIGVTEDAPVEALEQSLGVIAGVLRDY